MIISYPHLTLKCAVITPILTSSNVTTSIGALAPLSSASASTFCDVEGIMAAAVPQLMITPPLSPQPSPLP